ncbi:MAG TPA: DNA-processing protein DprA [Bacteroidota bacterium]|nr:DNA-processing protein DprA [Bacteroidota bacterium]
MPGVETLILLGGSVISVFDLLVISQIPGIGFNRLRTLVSHFRDTQAVVSASPQEISRLEGFNKKVASTVVHFSKSGLYNAACRFAETQLSRLNKAGGTMVSFWDKRYPELLRKIYDPPTFYYLRGNIADADTYALALVGTRSPSRYGTAIAEKLSRECASLGITVVSGLARGVDTAAHQAALNASGRTIAVIGSGIDVCYPPENRALIERLVVNGALLSEYEMGAKPDAVNFPRRNRIISGLSLGTIVIETDLDGGAMITANMALDQNREVFAVPGNITSRKSRGCHALIRDGKAKLVETMDDIIAELSCKLRPLLKNTPAAVPKKPAQGLSLFERTVYDLLSDEPLHIATIAERSRMAIPDLLVYLLALEFKGIVRQIPGKMFLRNPE